MDGGPGYGVPPEQGHVEWPLSLCGNCALRGGTDLESSSVHLSGGWRPFDRRLALEFPPEDLLCWGRSELFTCGLG